MCDENESSNKKLRKLLRLTSQEQMLLNYMDQFYKIKSNSNKFLNIINGNISIRLIDFFVTNYSKKNRSSIKFKNEKSKEISISDLESSTDNDITKKVMDPITDSSSSEDELTSMDSSNAKNSTNKIDSSESNESNESNSKSLIISIFSSYKSQLKAWNKKYFDPFSRGDRIPFFIDEDNCIITTIGQLNFFKWFISNNIYDYIINNHSLIEYEMNTSKKSNNQNKKWCKKDKISNSDNLKKNKMTNAMHSIDNSYRQINKLKPPKINNYKELSADMNLSQKGDENSNYQKKICKIEVRFD